MVATWFSVRYFPCNQRLQMLYLYTCGTVGFPFEFRCYSGGIVSVSSSMMWGAHCIGRLGACPGWGGISLCGSNLGGGSCATSRVSSGLSTLIGGVGGFCCCGNAFVGGGACGGAAMLKIAAICFRDDV